MNFMFSWQEHYLVKILINRYSSCYSNIKFVSSCQRVESSVNYKEQSTANSNSFKIAQKTAFEAKGQLYTTGKVIPRLLIIDLHTHLAIYGYR